MLAKTKYWLEFIFLLLVFGIDQFSKNWAQQRDLIIMNHGGVFGLYPSKWWTFVLGIVLCFVIYEWWQSKGLERWGIGLLMIGGLSNIVDRYLFGAVRDFIYYPWFRFYGNIADIVLAVGVGIAIIAKLISSETKNNIHLS